MFKISPWWHFAGLGLLAACPAFAAAAAPFQGIPEILQASAPADWRVPDPENVLYLELPAARDSVAGSVWLAHCYGMVGAGRDEDADSGGGTELYAVIGHAPRHLDRNVTLLGRVLQGIELLSSLPRAPARVPIACRSGGGRARRLRGRGAPGQRVAPRARRSSPWVHSYCPR